MRAIVHTDQPMKASQRSTKKNVILILHEGTDDSADVNPLGIGFAHAGNRHLGTRHPR